jgi:SNF2 family DNA or RNA helicase
MFANRNFASKYGLNTDKLFDVLSANIIRRRKDEVGIQLPNKTYVVHDIELPKDSEIYSQHQQIYRDQVLGALKDDDTPITLGSMFAYFHYLRMILLAPGDMPYNYYPVDPITLERSDVPIKKRLKFQGPFPKLQEAFEITCDLLDEGEPVVISSAQYNTPLTYLKDLFESIEPDDPQFVDIITGDTSHRVAEIEENFQQGRTKVLLLNSKAGAEGLNLQKTHHWPGGASHMIKLDEWWNPGVNEQVEDRLWRTGTREPVTIHQLFVENSVDVLIKDILDDKKALADEVMESESLRPTQWREKLKGIFGE